MNWLDKFKGKDGRPDGLADQGEDVLREPPIREVGGTVVRAGAKPSPTMAKPGIRFQPDHDVTVDLQIRSLLGSGGMGEVYLARQRLWDVDVALKIPNDEIVSDPENRHRILREAEAWTDLGLHPNIAYCYYAQPLGELLLLVIEYVDGGNLRDWIADGRCADLKTGLDLVIQFCHGLEHAHKKGLVHRDIKPENILLMKDGTLKITDFGIVHKAVASPEILESTGAVRQVAAGMTTAGIGTADYMAPEQWGDQSEIDLRADIFAFGICLYEMLCGARPYSMTAGPREEAPDPGRLRGGQGLPERLRRMMRKCVDWDREKRPASAQEVREELRAVYEEVYGAPCLHAELPELTSQADDWNNRALSYLALGRVEDAEQAWQTALEADPRHPESTYNSGLHRWRGAKGTDQEILANLRGVAEADSSSWLPRYLLAQVHLERGDAHGAREELAQIQVDGEGRIEVAAARQALEQLHSPTGPLRELEGNARFVCMSTDGRYALSDGLENTLKLSDCATGGRLRTFEGHTQYVKSVTLSADGRHALSGSNDNTMKLWEVASGCCVRTFEGHNQYVTSVALSANGRYALSGSDDKTMKLWEVASGRCVCTFEGHTRGVNSVCLSADGRLALSGSDDKTLKLWAVEGAGLLQSFEGHKDSVASVSMSADGRFVLSGSWDQTLKLWEVESGRCIRTFMGHKDYVRSVCFSTDGRYVLSGSSDKTLKLWVMESGRCQRTFEGHRGAVDSVCLSADGRFALSGGLYGVARLWKIGTFHCRASFRLALLSASAESIAAAGRYAAAMSDARAASGIGDAVRACVCLRRARQDIRYRRAASAVREWGGLYLKLRRGEMTDCWLLWRATHDKHCSVCLSDDGRFVLSGGVGTLKLWDVESGCCLRTLEGHRSFVKVVCLSADGRLALSGSFDKTMKFWEVEGGRCLRTFEGHTDWVTSVCLSADGRFALSGSKDKTLKVWDVGSGICLRTSEGHTAEVNSVCLSADGRFALSGSGDKTLKVWDVESGICLRTFQGHTNVVTSLALSISGVYALSGSVDKTLKLWEVASGRCLRTFQGHTEWVKSVRLSADGRFALSGSEDRTVKLWDVESGRCLRTLEHEAPVNSVCLTTDGQHVITACQTGIITAWFLDWELEENQPTDWEEGARPYLDVFLHAHQPYGKVLPQDCQPSGDEVTRALTRQGRPQWSEEDFKGLLYMLGCVGYGWLPPAGVRRELERVTQALPNEAQEQNLRRWQQSGAPKEWVAAHDCQWNHKEWSRLLEELATSEFWPMNPDKVGLVLEEIKRSIQASKAT